MLVDAFEKLIIPPDSQHIVCFVELTVPWEGAVEKGFEWKKLKYVELATEAEQPGWRTQVCPVEVGGWGFVATSTVSSWKELGVAGQALRQAMKETSQVAEWSSQCL